MNVKRILCPVDLSDNSLVAVEIATTIAKQGGAEIVFAYVSPHWLPEESMVGSEYIDGIVAERKQMFGEVKPTDDSVGCEHLFLQGSPGPEIVRASRTCDMVVMSTHGYSGIVRLMMGSVAQYTSRHADCPVILVRNPKIRKRQPMAATKQEPKHERLVTAAMHQVGAIQGEDRMDDVIQMLEKTRESAAPVVNTFGKCIGILTITDIDKYRDVRAKYDAGDESVVGEVFETNAYGQRRTTNEEDFLQVHRHMTAPVVTISNTESCRRARELFEVNTGIHHLAVVDESNKPVGILENRDVVESTRETSEA